MTLIAINASRDHAEFITDTSDYTLNGSELGRVTKHLTFPHLDAAVLTQGDSTFGDRAKFYTLKVANDSASFDEILRDAQKLFTLIWDGEDDPTEAVAFLVGYSEAAGRFTATAYPSVKGFAPELLSGLFVMPSPWTMRPSAIELDSLRRNENMTSEVRSKTARAWAEQPQPLQPRTIDDWTNLVKTVRAQRSLSQPMKVFVSGDVFHTRLERGAFATRSIHRYDDSGEEFLRMVSGTAHPLGLAGACWCGSGTRFVDCHLAAYLDQPCGCRSGENLRACCAALADPIPVS